MKALFHTAVMLCLMASSTVSVYASDADVSDGVTVQWSRTTELTEQAEGKYAGVTKYRQYLYSPVYRRVRIRAERFAEKWPAEIKQQWILLITARMGTIYPTVDIYDHLFLPPLCYPTNTIRKQRFQILDTQLTWVLADLLLEPSVRRTVQDIFYKEDFPDDPHGQHGQRAVQFCYESRRLEELLAQPQRRRAAIKRLEEARVTEQAADSVKGLEGSTQIDETPRLIAIGMNSQGDRYCYITPVDELLKQGDPYEGGHIQTISDDSVIYMKTGQSYSLSLDK